MTRSAIADHEGCRHFATLSVHVLNTHIRPFTAYWHKARVAGELHTSDNRHRFRRELIDLQRKLRLFMRLLDYLAEGDHFVPALASSIESNTVYPDYDIIDGEADPERTFHGLLTLVRLADIDLGVKIRPDLDELRVDELGNSPSHFVLCPIDYGQGQAGFLLYIKSSMTGNETEFLQNWRREHPRFPHESTADQLYDESQFEAYRSLGDHIANALFAPELTNPVEPNRPALSAQPKVHDWFKGLATNLLDPKDE